MLTIHEYSQPLCVLDKQIIVTGSRWLRGEQRRVFGNFKSAVSQQRAIKILGQLEITLITIKVSWDDTVR